MYLPLEGGAGRNPPWSLGPCSDPRTPHSPPGSGPGHTQQRGSGHPPRSGPRNTPRGICTQDPRHALCNHPAKDRLVSCYFILGWGNTHQRGSDLQPLAVGPGIPLAGFAHWAHVTLYAITLHRIAWFWVIYFRLGMLFATRKQCCYLETMKVRILRHCVGYCSMRP